jgi:DNA-directed RNA polymerase specialized sigma24 family protein
MPIRQAAPPADQLLRALSPHHRDILVATYFRRRTTREAAQQLGIPHDTVRTQLYQAMRELTGLLSATRPWQSPSAQAPLHRRR